MSSKHLILICILSFLLLQFPTLGKVYNYNVLFGEPFVLEKTLYTFYPDINYENVIVYKNNAFYEVISKGSCKMFDDYKWCVLNITNFVNLELWDGLCDLKLDFNVSQKEVVSVLNVSIDVLDAKCTNLDVFIDITSALLIKSESDGTDLKSDFCMIRNNQVILEGDLDQGKYSCLVYFYPYYNFTVIAGGTYFNGIRKSYLLTMKQFSLEEMYSLKYSDLEVYYKNDAFFANFSVSLRNKFQSRMYALFKIPQNSFYRVVDFQGAEFKIQKSVNSFKGKYYANLSDGYYVWFYLENNSEEKLNFSLIYETAMPVPIEIEAVLYVFSEEFGNYEVKDFPIALFETQGKLLNVYNKTSLVIPSNFMNSTQISQFLANRSDFSLLVNGNTSWSDLNEFEIYNFSFILKNNLSFDFLSVSVYSNFLIDAYYLDSFEITEQSVERLKSDKTNKYLREVRFLDGEVLYKYHIPFPDYYNDLDSFLAVVLRNSSYVNITVEGKYSMYSFEKNYSFTFNVKPSVQIHGLSIYDQIYCINITSSFSSGLINLSLFSKYLLFDKENYSISLTNLNKIFCSSYSLKNFSLFYKYIPHTVKISHTLIPKREGVDESRLPDFLKNIQKEVEFNTTLNLNLSQLQVYAYFKDDQLNVLFVSNQSLDDFSMIILPTQNYSVPFKIFFFDKIEKNLVYSIKIPIRMYNVSDIYAFLEWNLFGYNSKIITFNIINKNEVVLEKSETERVDFSYNVSLDDYLTVYIDNLSEGCNAYLIDKLLRFGQNKFIFELDEYGARIGRNLPISLDSSVQKKSITLYNSTCIEKMLDAYQNDAKTVLYEFNILSKNNSLLLENDVESVLKKLKNKYNLCNYSYVVDDEVIELKNIKVNLLFLVYCKDSGLFDVKSLAINKTLKKVDQITVSDGVDYLKRFNDISKEKYELLMSEFKKEPQEVTKSDEAVISESLNDNKETDLQRKDQAMSEGNVNNINLTGFSSVPKKFFDIQYWIGFGIILALIIGLYGIYHSVLHYTKKRKKEKIFEEIEDEYKIPKLRNDED
ncbi:MAG: hypothetical protein QW524_00030 [Candidatus Woesearchaeota archaeon]